MVRKFLPPLYFLLLTNRNKLASTTRFLVEILLLLHGCLSAINCLNKPLGWNVLQPFTEGYNLLNKIKTVAVRFDLQTRICTQYFLEEVF